VKSDDISGLTLFKDKSSAVKMIDGFHRADHMPDGGIANH
jgi:hypothetical protein